MELSRDIPNDAAVRIIRAYGPGLITTSHERIERSVALAPESVADWAPTSPDTIDAAAIAQLVALAPELILLGTGTRLVFPSHEALAPARAKRIGIEVMDTGAACRTWNLLTADGRRVVAGLLLL